MKIKTVLKSFLIAFVWFSFVLFGYDVFRVIIGAEPFCWLSWATCWFFMYLGTANLYWVTEENIK